MTEQTECRWSWCKLDKVGVWWGGRQENEPQVARRLMVIETDFDMADKFEGWWAYIGPIPPEPLPPKRKVTQTMWMVPLVGDLYAIHWLSPDDTIPPGAIETINKREVAQ